MGPRRHRGSSTRSAIRPAARVAVRWQPRPRNAARCGVGAAHRAARRHRRVNAGVVRQHRGAVACSWQRAPEGDRDTARAGGVARACHSPTRDREPGAFGGRGRARARVCVRPVRFWHLPAQRLHADALRRGSIVECRAVAGRARARLQRRRGARLWADLRCRPGVSGHAHRSQSVSSSRPPRDRRSAASS